MEPPNQSQRVYLLVGLPTSSFFSHLQTLQWLANFEELWQRVRYPNKKVKWWKVLRFPAAFTVLYFSLFFALILAAIIADSKVLLSEDCNYHTLVQFLQRSSLAQTGMLPQDTSRDCWN